MPYLLAGALLLIAGIALVVFLSFQVKKAPAVVVNLLHINPPTSGGHRYSGVFLLENLSAVEVTAQTGSYEKLTDQGWLLSNYGSLGVAKTLQPGATNIFELWLPTEEGKYRLLLDCYPEEYFSRGRSAARTMFYHAVQRWLPLRRQLQLDGVAFVTTEPFSVPKWEPQESNSATNPPVLNTP